MKKLLFAALAAVVMTSRVLAGCDWATETPADDGKYKYFVAKSYSEISASDAAKKAEQDIDAQIGRLFGTKLNVQSEFYSDEIGATGTTRSYERTLGAITLKGLERQKGDVEKKSKSYWIGCVQYRYSKSELETEKKRLKNMSPAELQKSMVFSEVAGDSTCRGAPVEIVTIPAGAYVTLDNGRYQGTSPIKFGNVCNGKHSLEITRDNYEPVTQQLVVPTSGRITKTLVRASKKITVKTTLGNSRIEINGVDKGKEPVTFKAELGIEQTITAINPEAVKVTRSLLFSKESNSTYVMSMEKLPGKIDFTAFKKRNPGVEVFVDGEKVSGDTSGEIGAYEHVIRFSKKGYNDIINTISVTGGETIYYSSSELSFKKYTPPPAPPKPSYKRSQFGWITGLEGWSNAFGYNVSGIEYQYRYDWFYMDASLLANLMFGEYSPVTTLETITSYYPYTTYTYSGTCDFDMLMIEYLRGSLGVNLSQKTAIFGMVSIGTLDLMALDYGVEDEDISASIIRYGFGIGYTGYSGLGIKAYYLTGSPEGFSKNIKTFGLGLFWGF